ncbi:AzlD domain-containing protein [Oscillatoria sp. FACHB-1407]|uniref:AzlD domain-containing protein n=1 Tax=Oscillatoria sp. FACHB-1407 TaxID=2692847 RepID=UPI001684D427|nr:AzlD domain-containing protein [Oscillatoria sp. FACHB-1407]MBD2462929.1 AzlD domain-containing protein [Oscillatoria sp. FACHB-1407]
MIWLIIALAGIGTYVMRSSGVWVPPKFIPTRWLAHLPLAVILVITVGSIASFTDTPQSSLGAIAATLAVILASLKKLPIVVGIAIGCVVFGALAGA